MSIVVKTIGGRKYRYSQQSRRVNGKVVTTSVYLGPLEPKRRRGGGFSFGLVGLAAMAVRAATGKLGPPGPVPYKEKFRAPDPRSPPSQSKAGKARMVAALAASERAIMKTPEFQHVRAVNEMRIAEQARFDRNTTHNVSAKLGGWDKSHQLNAEYVADQNAGEKAAAAPAPEAPAAPDAPEDAAEA